MSHILRCCKEKNVDVIMMSMFCMRNTITKSFVCYCIHWAFVISRALWQWQWYRHSVSELCQLRDNNVWQTAYTQRYSAATQPTITNRYKLADNYADNFWEDLLWAEADIYMQVHIVHDYINHLRRTAIFSLWTDDRKQHLVYQWHRTGAETVRAFG